MTDQLKGEAKDAVGPIAGGDGLGEEELARQWNATEREKVELARTGPSVLTRSAIVHEQREHDNQDT